MVNFVSRVFLYHVWILYHDHVCCFDRARFSPRLSTGNTSRLRAFHVVGRIWLNIKVIALAFGDQLVSTWGVTSPCFSDQSRTQSCVSPGLAGRGLWVYEIGSWYARYMRTTNAQELPKLRYTEINHFVTRCRTPQYDSLPRFLSLLLCQLHESLLTSKFTDTLFHVGASSAEQTNKLSLHRIKIVVSLRDHW